MSRRPQIPEKARKVVPLLGSQNEGEALGACRALGRVLHSAGLDFNDLANALPYGGGATEQSGRPTAAPPKPRSPMRDLGDWKQEWARRHRRPRTHTPAQEARQEAMAVFCRENSQRLGKRERAFVRSIRPHLDGLSIPQADWLADICARLEWENARLWQ